MKIYQTLALSLSLMATGAFLPAAPVPVEKGSAEEKGTTWGFAPDPQLPDVLIIGDSISIGYTPFVRAKLAGVANVFRPMEPDGKKAFNCGDTARGLDLLEDWLADRNWRVIHFNFGLHDLKWLDAKGAYVSPEMGKQVAPVAKYEKNLSDLVGRLKKTGAQLIFGATTPVPENSPGRVVGDDKKYNAIALKVMAENGVVYNDLVAALGPQISDYQLPANVHFNEAGSVFLADAVVQRVKEALAKPVSLVMVDRSYPKAFELGAPYRVEITKASTLLPAVIKLPRPLVFVPGARITAVVGLESPGTPTSLQVQLQSRNGKVSSLPVKGPLGKSVQVDLLVPEKPSAHPSAKNKEDWKEGDLITRLQFYYRFEAETTAVITISSCQVTPPENH